MLKNVVNNFENFHSGDVLIYGPKLKKFYDDLKKLADLEQLVLSEPLSRDFKLKYKRPRKDETD